MLYDRIDERVLDAAGPQLGLVSNVAVGYDNIDLAVCRERGVVVTNTPGVLTDATADLTIGLILALTRRIGEGERAIRRSEQWRWDLDFMLGVGLQGKTLGIVGLGKIGVAVAARARAFGMVVLYGSTAYSSGTRAGAKCDVLRSHTTLGTGRRRITPLPAHVRDAASDRRPSARYDESRSVLGQYRSRSDRQRARAGGSFRPELSLALRSTSSSSSPRSRRRFSTSRTQCWCLTWVRRHAKRVAPWLNSQSPTRLPFFGHAPRTWWSERCPRQIRRAYFVQ